MTDWQIVIAVSVLGGVIGGMGMGGGTLLIPLLTLAAGLEQHLAQSVNLMAFVPMSIVAVIIHNKNGYIDIKSSIPITCAALIGAIGGSLLARYSGGYILRAGYGAFLIALGAYQMFITVKTALKNRRQKKDGSNSKSVGKTAKV